MNPADVAYQEVPGAPGRYFRCTRYGLMNTDSCSRNFALAPKVAVEGRLGGCVGCPTGSLHSGIAVVAPPSTPHLICVRCRRDPTDEAQYRGTRQGRIRMVSDGLHCVSCFNRGREVALGRNARNTKPRALVLRDVRLAYVVDHKLSIAKFSNVKDVFEAALTVQRRHTGPIRFSWAGAGPVLKARGKKRDELGTNKPCVQLVLWGDLSEAESQGRGRALPVLAVPSRFNGGPGRVDVRLLVAERQAALAVHGHQRAQG